MTTFFTSDLHLGHARIIELCKRPFNNVEEMNQKIVENWNYEVDPLDNIFILGDLALGKIRETIKIVSRLNGTKYLIPGNHDRVWSGYPDKPHKALEMRELYESVGLNILPEQFYYGSWLLCHFPTSGDSYTDDRYPEYRPTLADGQWLIHGHVHTMWRIRGNQINVGMDQWDFTPVRKEVLEKLIYSKEHPHES